MKLVVSRHSSFIQLHRAVFKLLRWVNGSCRVHHALELGGSHGYAAANRHWSWPAGSHFAPCRQKLPLVRPTLTCPHASLSPASLLQLPTSVITPHPYLPSFIIAVPRPSRPTNLGPLQVLL